MKLARILPFAIILALSGCSDDAPPEPQLEWQAAVGMTDGAILSFWGDTADTVFGVGGSMLEGGGDAIVLRHDGERWMRLPLVAPTLWWVQGFGVDDVWAVGELGTVAHFDGTEWTVVETGEIYTLWGVWGASPAELWAVGGSIDGSTPSIMLHYDGSEWSEVAGVGQPGELLFKVWGTAADDVWAVGDGGAILHYDGTSWSRQSSPTTDRLLTVRGRSADDVYAVGGTTQAVLLHYDGAEWSQVDTGLQSPLMGVWTAPGSRVLVSGATGLIAIGDDTGWYRQDSPVADDLHASWGDGAGNFLAGGGNLLTIGPRRGAIVGVGDIATGPPQE